MNVHQVIFNDVGKSFGGIMVSDGQSSRIICGCCGIAYELDEIGRENVKIISWVNLDREIREGTHQY